jgi:subtilisin family serine protease
VDVDMERTREVLRLVVAALVVAAVLVSWGGGVLPSAQAAPGPAEPAETSAPGAAPESAAPVDADVQAKAAEGTVDVIAVTSAPGEQVAAAVLDTVPEGSVSAVDAGATSQLAVTVDAEGLEALRRAPYVERIVENGKNFVAADTWAENIGLPPVGTAGWDGSGQTIAILDSGVQSNHPYLSGKVVAEACFSGGGAPGTSSLCPGQSATGEGPGSAAPCTLAITECDHGTHVAGIAVGGPATTGGRVIQGVAPAASIVAVQIFTKGTTTEACSGAAPCVFAYDSDLNDALDWVRARVQANAPGFEDLAAVNLSLGGGIYSGTCDTDPTKPYVDALGALGVVTVAATGNFGLNGTFPGISSPACISTVVSVGATTALGTLASYSNLTAGTSILAPGGLITSSKRGSSYGDLVGTSMSTPIVSAAIALLRQQGTYTTRAQIVSRLTGTGDEVSNAFGRREIQVDSALLGVPNSPRDPAALPGESYVDVSWTAPTFTGDGPLAGYAVSSFPASGGCTTTGATTCRVTGLANGTTYAFTVQSIGAAGPGGRTTVTGTPRTVPGAPRDVKVVPAHESLTATWRAPVSDGGGAIDRYKATAHPSGRTCTTNGSLSCTIGGLTNGASYTVTVVALNDAGAGPASSPSASVTPVWAPNLAPGPPLGNLDSVVPGLRSVTVKGWTLDPEKQGPIQVHVYVDGAAVAVLADDARPDVAGVYRRYGEDHGFSAVVGASPGPHTVCAYGIGVGVGGNRSLGCRQVDVATGLPVGSLDDVSVAPRRISVSGWTLDPDVAASIQVTLTVDGVPRTSLADVVRPDVGSAFPGYGDRHGYQRSMTATPGFHVVCAYGIDTAGGGGRELGCRWLVVPTGPPFGSLDQVTRTGNTVTVSGWTIDPDTRDGIDVHLVVGSQVLAVRAAGERIDVGRAFPAYGAAHGYTGTFTVSGSGIPVCAYAINTGGGSNTLLGCRTV